MRRETILTAGIALLIVVSTVAMVAIPGAVAERDPGDLRPGYADIEEVTLAPGEVTAGTATLQVTAHLNHRGGRSGNVTLEVRAVDIESGMVATTQTVDVDPIEGDREVRVPVNVTVAREGGYRIETVLYSDDERVGAGSVTVQGVGTLQSGGQVSFHRFGAGGSDDLSPIQYSIADAGENRTSLDVSAYLTNRDDVPSGDMTVELVVRQAESNIVATRTTIDVGAIAPGETAAPGARVTVPAEYNYYLDAILREGNVIVDSTRSVANLNPTERIEADVTVREVGLQVEDFESENGGQGAREPPAAGATPSAGQPGFGVTGALAALATIGIYAWRRRQ